MEPNEINKRTTREFEEFILLQVRRSYSIHTACRWLYLLLAAAGVVLFFVGMMMHLEISGGMPILVMSAGFIPASFFSKRAAASYAEAADEIAYGLEHPECNVPEDYMDITKQVRADACNTLKSTKGLIASYGIIALACYAGTAVIFLASDLGGPWFEPSIFALSFVMATIAVVLTILTIRSIRDLPMARRYKQWLKETANGKESKK